MEFVIPGAHIDRTILANGGSGINSVAGFVAPLRRTVGIESMNMIRKLEDSLDTRSYEKLDETNRIAKQIKEKLF